ncbi:MAG: histidine triad nucleotide-binding protein [Tissierellia bacterium]|nr:histidine triad nucleotide-binding protein [Tissierellia bacterium]
MDCIFCKLANKEIPTQVVYEDEYVFAFNDTDPKAPIHLLFIPKKHISSNNDVENDDMIMAHIFSAIRKVAKDMGFDKDGYRIVNNVGDDGGQSVHHIHFHVMAGRKMLWPAG